MDSGDPHRKRAGSVTPGRRAAAVAAHAVLFACVAGQPLACVAQVYKWVDEKGVTQYSEKPPPGTKAQAVKTAPKADVADKARGQPEVKTLQQQELEFQRRRIEAEEARVKQEADDAKARREAGLRREACIGARRDLAALQEKRPVFDLDEKGERRYLDDKERAVTIRKTQEFVEKNCPK